MHSFNHHSRPHIPSTTSSNTSSNRSSYSAPSPSPSPPPTIHHRRTLSSRKSSSKSTSSRRIAPAPPSLPGISLPLSPFSTPPNTTHRHAPLSEEEEDIAPIPSSLPQRGETDAQCWGRMLALQREYHCYNSARLEAAVEALERGMSVEEVPVPSRFCLDLLNEELKVSIEEIRSI